MRITATELRSRLYSSVLDQVAKTGEPVTIIRKGGRVTELATPLRDNHRALRVRWEFPCPFAQAPVASRRPGTG